MRHRSFCRRSTVRVASAKNLVKKLKEYAQVHFAHEEQYMEKTNDPELEMQKTEHAEFRKKIEQISLEDADEEEAKKIISDLLEFLARWLYQKRAHEAFVDKIKKIDLREIDDNQEEYLEELIDYLLKWLSNHILKMDKKIPQGKNNFLKVLEIIGKIMYSIRYESV